MRREEVFIVNPQPLPFFARRSSPFAHRSRRFLRPVQGPLKPERQTFFIGPWTLHMTPFFEEFKTQSVAYFEANTPRIQQCISELSEAEVWQRPNGASNSVGNLVLHLCGNITQYVLSSLGGQPDHRMRDAEFAAAGGLTKQELWEKLEATTSEAARVMRQATEAELLRSRTVQGFQLSGIGIVVHVTEHYSYHTGQIAFWTKQLKNKDLGFWADKDLNAHNA